MPYAAGLAPSPSSRALLPPWPRQVRQGEVVVASGPVRKLAQRGDMMAEWLIRLLPTAGPRPA